MAWSNRIALRIIQERLFRYAPYWGEKLYKGTKKQLSEYIISIEQRAFDDSYCNNSCKDMYFCDLKKKHKGPHQEDCGLYWE